MKKILILFLCFMFACCSTAQPTTEVTFNTHKVKRKETLYSIAKKYNITEENIKIYNTELYKRQLKKGEKIRIPVFKTVADASQNTDVKKYKVQPKEGKWRIAYKFGITVATLEELNPNMGNVLKEGQEIIVPNVPVKDENTVDENYDYYTVKPKEGYYRLNEKLGLTKNELENLNPQLKEKGLQAGMVLKIPKTETSQDEQEYSIPAETLALLEKISTRKTHNITFVLPFKLPSINMEDSITVKTKLKKDRVLNYSLNFYSGGLMALDSLKQLGISVDVTTLDSEANTKTITKLLETTDFDDTDAVIGPFFPKPFNELTKTLKEDEIPVFAPLSNKNIEFYDNVFQTLPSEEILQNKMLNFIVENQEDKNLLFIIDGKAAAIKTKIAERFPDARIITPHPTKFLKQYNMRSLLSLQKENWVVVETNNEPLSANVASILNALNTGKRKITMLTVFSGNTFTKENISNIYLSNLHFHYPTVDKLSASNTIFSKKYEAMFGTTPNRYAVRGFDLTFDIILRLAAYNQNLYKAVKKTKETEYVENKFNYQENPLGGYYNTAAYIVKYENLEIIQVE